MTALSDFPITHRWPPVRPDVIQLYTLNTPNGIKSSVMLEECGLDYDAHRISISGPEDQFTPEFLSLNPNNKIPAIIDPDGPGGQPLALPGAVVSVTQGKRRQAGLQALAAGRVKLGEFIQQDVQRPTVSDDMVQGQQHHVLLLAQAQYADLHRHSFSRCSNAGCVSTSRFTTKRGA